MHQCDKCGSRDIKLIETLRFHDVFDCITCGNFTFKKIEYCCRKPFIVIAIERKSDPKLFLYEQCRNCGGSQNRSKPLSFNKYSEQIDGDFVNSDFEKWKDERNKEGDDLYGAKKLFNYHQSAYYKYQIYLSSQEWKSKRQMALDRDKNLCQECKSSPAEEVHHLSYANLFNESLEDLVSLCNPCHRSKHPEKQPRFVAIEINKQI